MRRAIGGALLALFLAVAPVTASHITWASATSSGSAENELRDRINAEHRRVCGVSLTPVARLGYLARYKATDMVLNNYFAHANPWTGRKFWNFMQTAGIKYSAAGEILVWNAYPDHDTARVAFNQFMGSTSHRSAIRSCTYTLFGVGSYKAGAKRMYAVEFIRP